MKLLLKKKINFQPKMFTKNGGVKKILFISVISILLSFVRTPLSKSFQILSSNIMDAIKPKALPLQINVSFYFSINNITSC